ncbi:DNA-3-methyladenine glycosylase family protein [Microlunatus flavus]|uniref:DNA-3-methyladenine glycosylase II n=1 Tax=Microlunatus flavus TaxID=1036181 RepID=A0A1H9LB45_9ACTN|nr:DNA-3-methyladenine glycosylase [Microlunatus flavus]SER08417.1 DNA-3-methyladenine glycosylase II [Microlunatus flavus]
MGTSTASTRSLPVTGPYDLGEVATMGFGHRDERSYDGVMRLAFCLDTDLERQVGVEVRQEGDRLDLLVRPAAGPSLSDAEVDAAARQVARVVSADHDGAAFHALCAADPVLAPVHAVAPGFRPALFYSPYEAAVWSVLSARRARAQAITLRRRLSQADGAVVALAGVEAEALPTPSALLRLESVPGLPADRLPRLHAIAEAAQRGELDVDALRALPPEEAEQRLQRLPGIGPFYASLVVLRACGHADVMPAGESHVRDAVEELYGFDHPPTPAELLALGEAWRPYRTWVPVMLRALAGRVAR